MLERGRVGQEWRRARWDSFVLNTPNWAQQLPGFAYAGPEPDAFAPLAEVIAYLEDYAASFAAPVREGVSVTALRARPGGGYELDTEPAPCTQDRSSSPPAPTSGRRRHRCATQLHPGCSSSTRRSTGTRPSSPMAPSSSSAAASPGCQVAEDLLDAGRAVYLSVGACPWVPRRHRGRDLVHWMAETGMLDQTVDTLTAPNARRMQPRCERH